VIWQQVHDLYTQVRVFKSWREIVLAADEDSQKPGFWQAIRYHIATVIQKTSSMK
jgi:hypothetical protein